MENNKTKKTLLQLVCVPKDINEEKLNKWAELFLFYWKTKDDNLHIEVAEA